MTKILVPLDGSNLSAAALPVAAWLSRGLNAEIILLTVGETPETTEHAVDAERYVAKAPSELATIGVLSEPMSIAGKSID
jgi:nucleotide-binding universal stress UspA family protein